MFYRSRFRKERNSIRKKHPDFRVTFGQFLEKLERQPDQGIALGKGCFKIRLAISSKGKGKSGGVRVITLLVAKRKALFLLSIYDKADKDTLSDKELPGLISDLGLEK